MIAVTARTTVAVVVFAGLANVTEDGQTDGRLFDSIAKDRTLLKALFVKNVSNVARPTWN